ncbi:hypothetical protein D0Y49_02485 [Lactobacillus johnsonii]|uniref:DUF4795 domain-containing protein n=1 Tax=Lactobacillus johnsonii TaxID=33959 RepID=UPI000E333E39|nr:DUF4795 domain-containing protein [Lactobacillus johnsonii]AXQ19320.1 hypothetical protein D0Y49_02485 [Lactobacillus johnsonii]
MSEYNKTILTNAGIDLARRANKGAATFQLTRGVSSTENLSEKTIEELQNLTQLPSIQQSVSLSDVVDTTDNPDTVLGIRMTFDNQNLNTGYNVHTVGVYAKEPGKGEILYGVATAKTPEYIPDFREQMLFKFDFLMYLVIGRTDKVTVQVSPDDVYLKKDTYNKAEIDAKVSDAVSKLNDKDAEILKNLNDYKQENKTYHQNLEQQLDTKADKSAVNQQLETKADKATTYTKDEVDNRILPKADKSYVDGELSKKADKTTTYTKDEVNSKIAGQVKSVNGHTADSNGEVTLPKLKATTLISYDVANKSGTLDENAGFDSNGNFSRWPVDQLVIGQLADAINAKLPIEAGAADDDLCHLTSSKISFWNGNGENVKNLPPMSNKQWFFAIRLVGPDGWGSVTVIDQDGTYWLNNKNGDIWTGWKRIANIDEVNSRLPLGGGEMAKGSTILWQGTNAGPNIQEGNIGGLQWNGATDYVKIFGDNNSSDNLDLAIQLGDDNSNRISIRDKDGTERAAITADGQFTGRTNWANVMNTGINNPTLFRHVNGSNTWNDIIGQDNGLAALVSFRDETDGSGNTMGDFSSGIVFGGGDTKGVLNVSYHNPRARIIGGNGTKPVWSKDVAWKDDLKVTVVRDYDVANNHETQHGVENLNAQWLVDQSALSPFAEAINALNTNLSTLRTELMNLKRRVDYNSPQGEFNNTTVNINDLRSTGIYRLANCYIQNGPYPTDNAHWIYVKVTVFDENTVYQTLYEGDNMYGRKSSSPTNWGKWYKYLNQAV